MEVVYRNLDPRPRKHSIVLVDWSVRESFHAIDYLNRQNIDRSLYEIIWVEYYDAKPQAIRDRLDRSLAAGEGPAVDAWIVVGMPSHAYYHKHLLYNIGILASRGEVVTFCDSDAVFTERFVERVVESFEREQDLVLHLDELRSQDRRFYPFNHPSVEEILAAGCSNLVDGRPAGLPPLDGTPIEDPLHTANYGACMSARRKDLIAIGGADEHVDFLGHVCGPYELTFRLINAGKREHWHEEEWLYHTWHPGASGDQQYVGPHDGRHMSTTALRTRDTGRIQPLVENPGIRALREAGSRSFIYAAPLSLANASGMRRAWSSEGMERYSTAKRRPTHFALRHPLLMGRLATQVARDVSTYGRLVARTTGLGYPDRPGTREGGAHETLASRLRDGAGKARKLVEKGGLPLQLSRRVFDWNREIVARVRQALDGLQSGGVREIAVYGTGTVGHFVRDLARECGVRVSQVVDDVPGVDPVETLRADGPPVVLAFRYGLAYRFERLLGLGIARENICILDPIWLEAETLPTLRMHGEIVDRTPKLSIILPTRGHADRTRALLDRVWETAAEPEALEVVLFVDDDDPASQAITHDRLALRQARGLGLTMGAITESAFRATRGRYVMLFNDDVRLESEGWDARIYEAFDRFPDDIALVWGNDLHQRAANATFPVVSRVAVEQIGFITSPLLNHYHIESHLHEIFLRLRRLGHDRMVFLPDVVFEHYHTGTSERPQETRGRDDRVIFMNLAGERDAAARRLGAFVEQGGVAARPVPVRSAAETSAITLLEDCGGMPEVTAIVVDGSVGRPVGSDARPILVDPGCSYELLSVVGDPEDRGRALHEAAARARGEVVVFLAPEMRTTPGWGRRALMQLKEDESLGALCGVVSYRRNERLVRAGAVLCEWKGEARLLEVLRGRLRGDPRRWDALDLDGSGLYGMLLRRSAFEAVGGLNREYRGLLACGVDLALRLRAAGYAARYDPNLEWRVADVEATLWDGDLERLAAIHGVSDLRGKQILAGAEIVENSDGLRFVLAPPPLCDEFGAELGRDVLVDAWTELAVFAGPANAERGAGEDATRADLRGGALR